jgi:hypothetical protein
MQRGRRSCALLLTAAIAAAAAIAAPALGTSYAFRNSAPIPSVPLAQAQLTFSCLPWPTGPTTGSLPFSTARSHARAGEAFERPLPQTAEAAFPRQIGSATGPPVLRGSVPVFEERLEVGLLAQVGLDVRKAFGHEGVEPVLGEVVVDSMQATLGQRGWIIGRRSVDLHGPFGPFFSLYRPAFQAWRTSTVFSNANSPQAGSSAPANQRSSATSSAGSGWPEEMRAVQ